MDCTNNAADLTQLKRINETSEMRSLRNKLVPLGGVWVLSGGEESKTQKMLKMAAEQLLRVMAVTNKHLELRMHKAGDCDSKLQQDATCCSKQMKHERCLRWWHYFD